MARSATARRPSRRERTAAAEEQTSRQPLSTSVRSQNDDPGPAVTATELAVHLDMTPQRVSSLANEGHIPRNNDGTFPQTHARIGYIRFIRRSAATRAGTGQTTTPLIETKTLKAKLELAIAQGEYVRIDDVEAVSVEADLNLRNELAGIGARITRDLELREKIDRAINDAIARHRNSLEAAAASAFGESESMDPDEEAAA
jgi:hypothetical protein